MSQSIISPYRVVTVTQSRSKAEDGFLTIAYSWVNIMPTSFISVTGISIGYITASTLMLISAPMNVKSLCGGMVGYSPRILTC